MDFKRELLEIKETPCGKKYGLYYGKGCIFSDKDKETVEKQAYYVTKYGLRAYRLIGDVYAVRGDFLAYNKWRNLHQALLILINNKGDTSKCFASSLELSRNKLFITKEHVDSIRLKYCR